MIFRGEFAFVCCVCLYLSVASVLFVTLGVVCVFLLDYFSVFYCIFSCLHGFLSEGGGVEGGVPCCVWGYVECVKSAVGVTDPQVREDWGPVLHLGEL